MLQVFLGYDIRTSSKPPPSKEALRDEGRLVEERAIDLEGLGLGRGGVGAVGGDGDVRLGAIEPLRGRGSSAPHRLAERRTTNGVDVGLGSSGVVDKLLEEVRDLAEDVDLLDESPRRVRLALLARQEIQEDGRLRDGRSLLRAQRRLVAIETHPLPDEGDLARRSVVRLDVDDGVEVLHDRSSRLESVSSRGDGDQLVPDDDAPDSDLLAPVRRRRREFHHRQRDPLAALARALEVGKVPLGGEDVRAESLDCMDEDSTRARQVDNPVSDAHDARDGGTGPEAMNRVAVSSARDVRRRSRLPSSGELTKVGHPALRTCSELPAFGETLVDDRDLHLVVVLALDRVPVRRGGVDGDGKLVGFGRPLVELGAVGRGRGDDKVGDGGRLEDVDALGRLGVPEGELDGGVPDAVGGARGQLAGLPLSPMLLLLHKTAVASP